MSNNVEGFFSFYRWSNMELNDGYREREWRKPVSECILEEWGRRISEVCLVWRRYGGKEGLSKVSEGVVAKVFILFFLHVSHDNFLLSSTASKSTFCATASHHPIVSKCLLAYNVTEIFSFSPPLSSPWEADFLQLPIAPAMSVKVEGGKGKDGARLG